MAKLSAVPFTDVRIHDSFWSPRQEINRTVSIPLNFEMLEKFGNLRNLELAGTRSTRGFTGPAFMDSNVYKALEAASYSLATHPDPAIAKRLDDVIAVLATAQLPERRDFELARSFIERRGSKFFATEHEIPLKDGLSFTSGNCQPWGINDGLEPRDSNEQPDALCHWWPHRGADEWAQYTWKTPMTVQGAKVYWFDDTGRGACRLPESWPVGYLDGSAWKPVTATSDYPIKKDGLCEVSFAPVKTATLRLEVQMRKGWAAGVHEWKVQEGEED